MVGSRLKGHTESKAVEELEHRITSRFVFRKIDFGLPNAGRQPMKPFGADPAQDARRDREAGAGAEYLD
jgi:hypothetical protein